MRVKFSEGSLDVRRLYLLSFLTRLLPLMVLLFFASGLQAQGFGPGFHARAGGNLDCPFDGGTVSSLTPPASVGPVTFPCTSGSGVAGARSGAGTVGGLATTTHECCGSASGAGSQSRFEVTSVVITGP